MIPTFAPYQGEGMRWERTELAIDEGVIVVSYPGLERAATKYVVIPAMSRGRARYALKRIPPVRGCTSTPTPS